MNKLFKILRRVMCGLILLTTIVSPSLQSAETVVVEMSKCIATAVAASAAAIYYAFMQNNGIAPPVEQMSTSIPVAVPIVSAQGKSHQQIADEITQAVVESAAQKYNLTFTQQQEVYDAIHAKNRQQVVTIGAQVSATYEQTVSAHLRSQAEEFREKNARRANIQLEKDIQREMLKAALLQQISQHPAIQPLVFKHFNRVMLTFFECNHPVLSRRINARMYISEASSDETTPSAIFGLRFKEATLNLQDRYFDKNGHLVNIELDRHLPATIIHILKNPPHNYSEQRLEEVYQFVKDQGLDPEGLFEQMRSRRAGEGSRFKRWWTEGKWKYHSRLIGDPPDRRQRVLHDCNFNVYEVARLCEKGNFLAASNLIDSRRPLTQQIYDHYREKLCNDYGILKKYEKLWLCDPQIPWRSFEDSLELQQQTNDKLKAQYEQLSDADYEKKCRETKAVAEARGLAHFASSDDPQSGTQPSSQPQPPVSDPDEPDKEDQEQDKVVDRKEIKTVDDLKNLAQKLHQEKPLERLAGKTGKKAIQIRQAKIKTNIPVKDPSNLTPAELAALGKLAQEVFDQLVETYDAVVEPIGNGFRIIIEDIAISVYTSSTTKLPSLHVNSIPLLIDQGEKGMQWVQTMVKFRFTP